MVLIFDDELVIPTVQDFCDAVYNKLVNNSNPDDKLNIYFSTCGGDLDLIRPITDLILKYRNYIKLYLILDMDSAGFDILQHLTDIPIYVTNTFRGSLVHTSHCDSARDIDRNKHYRKSEDYWNDKFIKNLLDNYHITKAEGDLLKRGKDLLLDRNRILHIFPNLIEE